MPIPIGGLSFATLHTSSDARLDPAMMRSPSAVNRNSPRNEKPGDSNVFSGVPPLVLYNMIPFPVRDWVAKLPAGWNARRRPRGNRPAVLAVVSVFSTSQTSESSSSAELASSVGRESGGLNVHNVCELLPAAGVPECQHSVATVGHKLLRRRVRE